MKKINLSNKSYTTMYKEVRFLVEPTIEKVGEIVCIKYCITADEYKKKLTSCRAQLDITKNSQEKLLNYYNWINQFQQMLEKNKVSYEVVINSFLESDYLTVDEFCRRENYPKTLFEYSVGAIRFLNADLYNSLLEEVDKREKQFEENTITSGRQIMEKINNPEGRNFDIIDYYLDVKVKPMKLFYMLKKEMPISEMGEFKNFARKNNQLTNLSYDAIQKKFDDLVVFNCKKDLDNKSIINTGRMITDEEKLALINYLLENGVPVTEETYHAGLLRYRDNTFDFVSCESKVKVKEKTL